MAISNVLSCSVGECSYNRNKECHASSITVGTDHALCDTFTRQVSGEISEQAMPNVNKCNVDVCKFNMNLNCMAPGISVGNHMDHADCVTYVPKS